MVVKSTSRKVGSEKAALEVARKIEAKLTLGEAFLQEKKPAVPKLEEYYQRVKRTYMATPLKPSTYITYESSFRVHIIPQFGRLHLDQIDRQKIEDFIAKLVKKDMAKDSIRLILAALRILYTQAVEHRLVTENPVKGVGKFYRHAPKRHEEIEPLTEEESLAFLDAALTYDPEHYPLFLLALHTGMRSGEIGGLQWGDIDWNGKFISVRRAIVRGRITTVKTKHARRKVDCSDDLLRTLADFRRSSQEKALRSGSNEICPWVFTHRKGKPVDMNNVKIAYFKKVLRKAGLRDIRFHDLRHTYTSLLLAQGEPVTYVANQLGHANPQITMRIYSHWVPNKSQREAVNQLPSLTRQPGQRRSKVQRVKKIYPFAAPYTHPGPFHGFPCAPPYSLQQTDNARFITHHSMATSKSKVRLRV